VVKTADWSAAVLSNWTWQVFETVLNVPRLKPIVCVASGPTAVRVATMLPPVWVTNETTFAPFGFRSPVNVSTVVCPVGTMGLMVVV